MTGAHIKGYAKYYDYMYIGDLKLICTSQSNNTMAVKYLFFTGEEVFS
jgi:hypothetical protein